MKRWPLRLYLLWPCQDTTGENQTLAASCTLVMQLMSIAPCTETMQSWWDCGSLPSWDSFSVLKWSYRYNKQPRLSVPLQLRVPFTWLHNPASLLLLSFCSVAWGWVIPDPCSARSSFTPSSGHSSELLRHGWRSFSGHPLSREALKATLKVFLSLWREFFPLFCLFQAAKCWLLGEPGTKMPP